jgi:stearoyl-CoA desaturase (delta-9 desaturase)
VKGWQIDPTKWIIWTLAKLRLARKLRRVPSEKILLAELAEAQRRLEHKLESGTLTETAYAYIHSAYERLQVIAREWTQRRGEEIEVSREMLAELREEVRQAMSSLKLRGMPQPEMAG